MVDEIWGSQPDHFVHIFAHIFCIFAHIFAHIFAFIPVYIPPAFGIVILFYLGLWCHLLCRWESYADVTGWVGQLASGPNRLRGADGPWDGAQTGTNDADDCQLKIIRNHHCSSFTTPLPYSTYQDSPLHHCPHFLVLSSVAEGFFIGLFTDFHLVVGDLLAHNDAPLIPISTPLAVDIPPPLVDDAFTLSTKKGSGSDLIPAVGLCRGFFIH